MRTPLLVSTTLVCVLMLATISTASPAGADDLHGSFDEVILWDGPVPGQGNLLYTIELDQERRSPPIHRVYEGIDIGSLPPEFTFNDTHFFKGIDRAHPLFTMTRDGERVYEGAFVRGKPIYRFERLGRVIRVYSGPTTTGDVLYTFTEHRVHSGPNTQGDIVLSTDRNLLAQRARVVQVIVLLLEMKPRLEGPGSFDTQVNLALEGLAE